MGGRLSTAGTEGKDSRALFSKTPTETTQEKALENTATTTQEKEEEEEEEECGFCLFMKGGPCKEPFTAWQKCVVDIELKKMRKNEEDENDEEKCGDVAYAMHSCIAAHPEYYSVVERAKDALHRPEIHKDDAHIAQQQQQQSGDSAAAAGDNKGDLPN